MESNRSVSDPHSFYAPHQPKIVHIDWLATVCFEFSVLACSATIRFERGGETSLDLRGIVIEKIVAADGAPISYVVHPEIPVRGSQLSLFVPDDHPIVTIWYQTSVNASGLQWLTPEQASSAHPYLFSVGECIHARSFLPCQDTPSVRFTYTAELTVPRALRGLMAARHLGGHENDEWVAECYEMPVPVPSYLFAFAVGEIEGRDITPRTTVYASPDLVEVAASEFAAVGSFLSAAEELFGPYDWERFDLLLLPWSFPYGGMENPRLAFLTPTLITGDGSLVSVVIHELMHSWTGNVVTNATWGDFWLNEGWTTYAEWRVNERVYGTDLMHLHVALRGRGLERDLRRFEEEGRAEFTALATGIPGTVDPDDVFSQVPYGKGALFLMALEQCVGRQRFDLFIREYLGAFRFKSITTKQFLAFTARELPGALEVVGFFQWVFGAGLPASTPRISSRMLDEVVQSAEKIDAIFPEWMKYWIPAQWTLYLELVRIPAAHNFLAELDHRYQLMQHQNIEVSCAFHLLAIRSGYVAALSSAGDFFGRSGRMKYVIPLAKALNETSGGRLIVERLVESMEHRYHPIALKYLKQILSASAQPIE